MKYVDELEGIEDSPMLSSMMQRNEDINQSIDLDRQENLIH